SVLDRQWVDLIDTCAHYRAQEEAALARGRAAVAAGGDDGMRDGAAAFNGMRSTTSAWASALRRGRDLAPRANKVYSHLPRPNLRAWARLAQQLHDLGQSFYFDKVQFDAAAFTRMISAPFEGL